MTHEGGQTMTGDDLSHVRDRALRTRDQGPGTGDEDVTHPIHPTQRFVPPEPATVDGHGEFGHPDNDRACDTHDLIGCPCNRDPAEEPIEVISASQARDHRGLLRAMNEGMTAGRPVTPPVARMLFLAAEVEPLRVELERCEGDLAVAVREAGAARAALRDATKRADRAEADVWGWAADDVHREARWQQEQRMRGMFANGEQSVDRLAVVESIFRNRAAALSGEVDQ